MQLNERQREAVEHDDGPVLVLAGAGSGKTRVLTSRVARLVEQGISPRNIMAVTFTNKAAGEMRTRVGQQLGRDPVGLWIGTFHSLSARLLRREAGHLGFSPQFTIYDETDRLSLIKQLLKEGRYSPRAFKPSVVQWEISGAKNSMLSPDDYHDTVANELQEVAADIYRKMNAALLRANAMDFDDLLLHPLTLFRDFPDRLEKYQRMFMHVLVDEFQDTNRAQYLLVKQLTELSRNLCAVGDDDQSIYGWRGADVRNMLDFQNDYPEVAVVRLEENYRSTAVILEAANGVIAENSERLGKTLFTQRSGGEPVVVLQASDERDESEWIAREIRSDSIRSMYANREIAILYRTNAQSRAFEDVFRRNAIPFRVVGAVSFYKRREVKDLISYLRLIVNPSDDEAFMRAVQAPRRGVGLTSLAVLQSQAAQWNKPLLVTASIADRIPDLRGRARDSLLAFCDTVDRLRVSAGDSSPAAVLEELIEAIDYESYMLEDADGADRMDNVRALVSGAAEWSEEEEDDDSGTPIERYLATAALTTSSEEVDGDPEGVTLMTVHTGKGLEWPVVFIAGLEDGLFPLSRSLDTMEGTEEERRLAYVGITRARDRLYLTWARTRRRQGQLMPGIASRFLDELPTHVIDERHTGGLFGSERFSYGRGRGRSHPSRPVTKRPVQRPSPVASAPKIHYSYEDESQDAPRYVKGERVKHRKFGSGGIVHVEGRGRDLKVVIAFDDRDIGKKTLLAAYAGLERDWD